MVNTAAHLPIEALGLFGTPLYGTLTTISHVVSESPAARGPPSAAPEPGPPSRPCEPAATGAIHGGAATDGSSLFCNSTTGAPCYGLRAGADPQTWQFADDVHPTTHGHKVIGDAFANQLHLFNWI